MRRGHARNRDRNLAGGFAAKPALIPEAGIRARSCLKAITGSLRIVEAQDDAAALAFGSRQAACKRHQPWACQKQAPKVVRIDH